MDACDVLITEQMEGDAVNGLKQKYDVYHDSELWNNQEELTKRLAESRAVIVRNQTRIHGEMLLEADRLCVIGRAGVGYDNIDVAAASKKGVVVCFTPGANAIATAEHTLALMLALMRKIPAANGSAKQGHWERNRFVGGELYTKTLGVLGVGSIGMRVAMRAKAFGMRILAFDKYLSKHRPELTETGAELVPLDTLLRRADVVCNHLPATEETNGLLDYSSLQKMKQTAYLINTARGQTVVERDLIRALQEDLIAGAALDVRETEPPECSELNSMENVILTPHIAAFTREAQRNVLEMLAGDVDSVLSGEAASHYVNFARPKTA